MPSCDSRRSAVASACACCALSTSSRASRAPGDAPSAERRCLHRDGMRLWVHASDAACGCLANACRLFAVRHALSNYSCAGLAAHRRAHRHARLPAQERHAPLGAHLECGVRHCADARTSHVIRLPRVQHLQPHQPCAMQRRCALLHPRAMAGVLRSSSAETCAACHAERGIAVRYEGAPKAVRHSGAGMVKGLTAVQEVLLGSLLLASFNNVSHHAP